MNKISLLLVRKSLVAFSVGHDASACVVPSSGLWGYENAERLDGLKQSSDYQLAIDRLLLRLGVKRGEVSVLAFTTTQGAAFPILNEKKLNILNWLDHKYISILTNTSDAKIKSQKAKWLPISPSSKLTKTPAIKVNSNDQLNKLISGELRLSGKDFIIEGSAKFYGKNVKCFHVEHHLAHICSAFWRYSSANVCISMDGASHNIFSLKSFPYWGGFSVARCNNKLLFSPPSLFTGGILYSYCSQMLDLTEGKLMGLSGYCLLNSDVSSRWIDEWEILLHRLEEHFNVDKIPLSVDGNFDKCLNMFAEKLRSILSRIAGLSEHLLSISSLSSDLTMLPSPAHILIAGSVQKVFERMRIKAVKKQLSFFVNQGINIEGVVFTGGCTLNCPSNQKLVELLDPINLYFDNACNDEGLSLGAAYAVSLFELDKSIQFPSAADTPFIGSYPCSIEDSKGLATELGFEVIECPGNNRIADLIAGVIDVSKVFIMCHGRYEAGPRALGNRSFLAKASDRRAHDLLNRIKQRENWRPIAPMVRDVDFHEYFVGPMEPNMLMNDRVINSSIIPAVSHIDESARVQVVSDKFHITYGIMTSLHNSGSCPVLANTSLNQKEEPLINSALRCLELMIEYSDIGGSYFGDFLVLNR